MVRQEFALGFRLERDELASGPLFVKAQDPGVDFSASSTMVPMSSNKGNTSCTSKLVTGTQSNFCFLFSRVVYMSLATWIVFSSISSGKSMTNSLKQVKISHLSSFSFTDT